MTSNVTRTNNGKRLMAAVAVLALVACCFIAFMPSTDAVDPTVSGEEYDGQAITARTEAQNIYVPATESETTITISGTGSVNLYIAEGADIKISGSTATVNVYRATGFTDGTISYVSGLEIAAKDTNVFAGIANNGIKTNATVSAGYGIAVTPATSDSPEYYAAGADIGTVQLNKEGSKITVINGSADVTVSGYTVGGKSATASVSIDETTASTGVAVTWNSTAAPSITSDATAGSITINSGVFSTTGINNASVLNAYADAAATGSANIASAVTDLTSPSSLYVYGEVADGTIELDTVNFNNATVDRFVFGATDKFTVGADKFTGALTAVSGKVTVPDTISGGLNLANGSYTAGATTINENSTLSVGVNATLKLTGIVTLNSIATTDANPATFNVYGKLTTDSTTATELIEDQNAGDDSEIKGVFNAYSTATISEYIIIGATNYRIDGAMKEAIINKDVNSSNTYSQLQTVRVTEDITISEDIKLGILGQLIIDEGASITIEKGAYLYIGATHQYTGEGNDGDITKLTSSTASVVMNGDMEIKAGGTFQVVAGKSVDIYGDVETAGKFIATAKTVLKNGATMEVSEGGLLEVSAAFQIDNGASVKVEGTLKSADVSNYGTITIDGIIDNSDTTKAVKISMLGNGAKVVINSAQFTTAFNTNNVLTFTDEKLEPAKGVTAVSSTDANTISITPTSGTWTTSPNASCDVIENVTITENVTSTTDNKGVKTYYVTMDIAGMPSAEVATTGDDDSIVAGTGTVGVTLAGYNNGYRGVTVSGQLTLGEGVTLTNAGKLTVSGQLNQTNSDSKAIDNDSGVITVTGQIKTLKEIDGTVNAAMYESQEDSVRYYIYTTLAAAVAAAPEEIEVLGTITLTENVTIPSPMEVDASGAVLINVGTDKNRNVTLTVENGAELKGAPEIQVYGTVYFENNKDSNKNNNIVSDVYTTDGTDARFTNIYTALAGATDGDTVEITKEEGAVEINQNITIVPGVTLKVPAGKQIELADGVTVTVQGTLDAWDAVLAETAFAEQASVEDKTSAIVVTGTFVSVADVKYSNYFIPGAYYTISNNDGDFNYVTPVEAAAAVAGDVSGPIAIYGENVVGSVAFVGTEDERVVVNVYGELVADSISLTYASFTVGAAAGTYVGSYTGAVGAAAGTVDVIAATGFIVYETTVNETSKVAISGAPAAFDGSEDFEVTIATGIVYAETLVEGNETLNFTIDTLTVAAGATFNVDGTGNVASIKEDLIVEGTANATDGGKIASKDLVVLGTFTVGAAVSADGIQAGQAEAVNAFVGISEKDTLGTAAALNAESITGLKVVYLSAGSTVTDKLVDGMKSTEFYVEDALYLTVYAVSGSEPAINSIAYPELAGKEVDAWQYVDSNGKTVKIDANSKERVGEVEKIDALMDYDVYVITIVAEYGITDVYIDGDLVDTEGLSGKNDLTTTVAVGEHQITYRLNNYFAGDVKITLNGEQLTDGKFTITSDMPFENDDGTTTEYKIVLTGVEAAAPDTPSQGGSSGSSDDGMGLTDYLLIVLIVLIVIMAIMVALRLMRS